MSFAVVLDTCALYPAHLRDTCSGSQSEACFARSGQKTSSRSSIET